MPKKVRRGRQLLFPSKPHADRMLPAFRAAVRNDEDYESEDRCGSPRDRWHPEKREIRARRKRQRMARKLSRSLMCN
jgi:hypothetical protein